MSNTPSDEELDSVLCHHWPAFSMQAVLVRMWLRDAMRAALAKWGTPQPAPLSDDAFLQIRGALEAARNGLTWFMEMHPEDCNSSDDEMLAQIDAALAAQEGKQ